MTSDLRAGRGLRWRVHSLSFRDEKFNFGAGATGADGVPELMIEVATKPHIALQRIETSPFFVRGARSLSFHRAETEFEGCYLTVIASRQFQVPRELAERFRQAPDAAGLLDEVVGAVGDLRGGLRQKAIHAATVCAVELSPAVLEPWLEFDMYWTSPTHHRSRYSTIVSEILESRVAAEEEVRALGESVLLAALDSPYRRAIELAGGWYLKGRSEPAASTERFIGLFQCLEALTNCAPQEPDPRMQAWFESIAVLLVAATTDERSALEQTLAVIKQRLARPTLSQRFSRLLDLLQLDAKAEMLQQFDMLNKLRNDLLHAHTSFVPAESRGYDVDRTVTELARVVLAAAVKRTISDAKERGHTVGYKDSRDAV